MFTEQDIDPSQIWRWCWERRGVEGEEGVRGWDGWMVAPVRWTWTGANSGRWWGTGGPGVLPSMGSQSQTRLGNWATATCNNSPWFWNPALQSSSPSPSTLYLGQQISSSKNSGCDTSAHSLRDVAPTISDTWRKDSWGESLKEMPFHFSPVRVRIPKRRCPWLLVHQCQILQSRTEHFETQFLKTE